MDPEKTEKLLLIECVLMIEDKELRHKLVDAAYERVFGQRGYFERTRRLMFSLEMDQVEEEDDDIFDRGEGGELHYGFFKLATKFTLPHYENYHVYCHRPFHMEEAFSIDQDWSTSFKIEMPYATELSKKTFREITKKLTKAYASVQFKNCYFTATQALKILAACSHLVAVKFKNCRFESFGEKDFRSFVIRSPSALYFQDCVIGDVDGYDNEISCMDHTSGEIDKLIDVLSMNEMTQNYGKEIYVHFITSSNSEFGMTLPPRYHF